MPDEQTDSTEQSTPDTIESTPVESTPVEETTPIEQPVEAPVEAPVETQDAPAEEIASEMAPIPEIQVEAPIEEAQVTPPDTALSQVGGGLPEDIPFREQ